MKTALSLLLTALWACASSVSATVELTPDNFDELTAGKTVFIKFFAPWCGHCKALAPDWDKLAKAFKNSKDQLIADVDCTAEGEPLCQQHGIEGFPTLKWGDPSDLQDYEGSRDYDALKTFAEENLKPQCSPKHLDLCDDDKKAEIQKYMKMNAEDLKALIAEKEEAMAKIDSDFEQFIQGLQEQYEKEMERTKEEKENIKKSGLGLMKAVRASLQAESGGKEEL